MIKNKFKYLRSLPLSGKVIDERDSIPTAACS